MPHQGSCLCGQVSYVVDAEPLGARLCWCRDCQKIASGSATMNVLFPEGSVEFAGAVGSSQRVADSGNTIERSFCTGCGSQLFSRTVGQPGLPIRIRAGTLDDPELMPPQMAIFTASAPHWARFDPDLPLHPGMPPPPGAQP